MGHKKPSRKGAKGKKGTNGTDALLDDDTLLDAAIAANKKLQEQHLQQKQLQKTQDPAGAAETAESTIEAAENYEELRGTGAAGQTKPPRVPVSVLFAGQYSAGTESEYTDENRSRTTDEEKRYLERTENMAQKIADLRRAAEVHREVRKYARESLIRPGASLMDVAEGIEAATRALVEADGLRAGIGFPTGLSLNSCAAHYTPNAGDHVVINADDVLKVDFGVHVNGHIIDSAFTMSWNPRYDPLLNAVRAATARGVECVGIDARLNEIGEQIQEVMESFEVELNGKMHPVRAIGNLSGHNIDPYRIHGGKSVPIVKGGEQIKMEEGELFAIETFGSTGRGYVSNDGVCSHYAKRSDSKVAAGAVRLDSAQRLLRVITENFDTLPFCRRYLDRLGQRKYILGLNNLVQLGIVQDYPPLFDIKGSYTAQFEHTLILKPTCKEILSVGDDY